jgi:hypothetical protein
LRGAIAEVTGVADVPDPPGIVAQPAASAPAVAAEAWMNSRLVNRMSGLPASPCRLEVRALKPALPKGLLMAVNPAA